jgi:long-chain alkane monooxygenase
MASFDHLSNGRAGINVVTAFHRSASTNLGIKVDEYHQQHDFRYDRADEFMEVCYRLWDSWEEGAIVQDVNGDMFADPEKVHAINHEGEHFSCSGPLNIHRSPQGKPVIVQAGQSPRGIAFAAKHAEAVFSIQRDRAGMKQYYDMLKEAMLKCGRKPDSCKVFFGLQVITGKTEDEAAAKAALHNAMVTDEAGMAILSGHLGQDLSTLDPNTPITDLTVPGIQGLIDSYKASLSDDGATLADVANNHAVGVGIPQIVGDGAHVADWMSDTIDQVGGDGFLLSIVYAPGSVEEFCEFVIPELQQRGRVRTEYLNGTLRDNLLAF